MVGFYSVSELFDVEFGVPQGSTAIPIIFFIYTSPH